MTQNLCAHPDGRRVMVYPGANWIHDLDEASNPLYRVARRLDLRLHETSSDHEPGGDVCLFDAGRIVPPDVFARVLDRYRWMKGHWNLTGDDPSYEGMMRQNARR